MKDWYWLNIPNMITMGRVACIPLLVILLYFSNPFWTAAAAVIFALVGISDCLDGWLARRLDKVTVLGQYLDPLADKLLVAAMLVMLVWLNRLPAWVAIIIISREICVTGLRAMSAENGFRLPSDAWGKIKTILQLIALDMLILHYPRFDIDFHEIGSWVMWVVLVITVWSGVRYAIYFKKLFPQRGGEG
ncbi:MAG: CDP-diacylglycerol--glycerol-3-phosphate 3-phosphatidyltransferase [Desulfarculales bacterium]|jgi:CDP-diacylglycerol--glycerol-3-phosphate 3-phosphatidyltransferase|nr:CDP-diacylglycerol--glycerol-3-phosphate 3-phosphatidyltransferase [Desulfarculales bacterium]